MSMTSDKSVHARTHARTQFLNTVNESSSRNRDPTYMYVCSVLLEAKGKRLYRSVLHTLEAPLSLHVLQIYRY